MAGELKRVKVTGDGTIQGTHMYNEDGGEIHVRAIRWSIDMGHATLELEVPIAALKFTGEAIIGA